MARCDECGVEASEWEAAELMDCVACKAQRFHKARRISVSNLRRASTVPPPAKEEFGNE